MTLWWSSSADKVFPSTFKYSSNEEARRIKSFLPLFIKPDALRRYVGFMDAIAQQHFASRWDDKNEVVVAPTIKEYVSLSHLDGSEI